jgi:hypothetical protein
MLPAEPSALAWLLLDAGLAEPEPKLLERRAATALAEYLGQSRSMARLSSSAHGCQVERWVGGLLDPATAAAPDSSQADAV